MERYMYDDEDLNSYYMHRHTGSVALLSDWIDTWYHLSPEERGGDTFADADLVRVMKDKDEWISY